MQLRMYALSGLVEGSACLWLNRTGEVESMISANQLTILRMVFVPIFVFLVLEGHLEGALTVFYWPV